MHPIMHPSYARVTSSKQQIRDTFCLDEIDVSDLEERRKSY